MAHLRHDLAALNASPARPRDTLLALALLSLIVLAAGTVVATLARPVSRLQGIEQPVSSLRWVDDDLLELGTVGLGVVTWQVSSGTLQADADPDRADLTVLSLPMLPPGAVYEHRPAVTLLATPLAMDDSAFMQRALEAEGRLPILGFRGMQSDPDVQIHYVAQNLAVGADAILWYTTAHSEGLQLQWLSTADGSVIEKGIDYSLADAQTRVTAMAASPAGEVALTGDENGSVAIVDLSPLASGSAGPPMLYLHDFGLPGDGPVQPTAVVALAVSGTGEGLRVAAAAADGRIVILRAVDSAEQSPEILPLRNMLATDAGLPMPTLWVEPVGTNALLGAGDSTPFELLGFARDRSTVMFHDSARNRLIQAEVGGTALAVLPLGPAAAPSAVEPAALTDAISDLPFLRDQALRLLLGGLQVASAAGAANPPAASYYQTLREALPWKLPFDLLLGTTASLVTEPATRASTGQRGSARDPDTGRVVLWDNLGQILVLTPGDENQSADFGDGRLVADAAFEPGSGALVVLYADGTARRWSPGAGAARDFSFAAPAGPDGAPLAEALALAFPPGEMVTMVHWSRTATAPAVLRRYDRATATPLGPGIDVGFEDFILPDRSNLIISEVNGQGVLLRDTRTGATVLEAAFEGGLVQIAPSNDGRDLGVVTSGDAIWTLRIDPPGGGTPPPIPTDLSYLPLGEPVAVPLPAGVAREGLTLSNDGGTLLARTRDGQLFASRRGAITSVGAGAGCCIELRRILPGVVALRAALTLDGSQALVAGADHMLWLVDLDEGDTETPLVQLGGPVRHLALSPDGTRLSVAAEGMEPVVVDWGRAAWLSALPIIGHAPYVVPAPLRAREIPLAALPLATNVDTVVLGTFTRLSDAVALRDSVRATWSNVSILQIDLLYTVTVGLGEAETRSLSELRQSLAQVRAAAPAASGASLAVFSALCPTQDSTATVPPVDVRCQPVDPPPPSAPAAPVELGAP
jgi:hypothetical protein